jgi:hypothetical protein
MSACLCRWMTELLVPALIWMWPAKHDVRVITPPSKPNTINTRIWICALMTHSLWSLLIPFCGHHASTFVACSVSTARLLAEREDGEHILLW